MSSMLRAAITAILLAVALGCAGKRSYPPPQPEEPSTRGKVGFEFIANPAPGSPQVEHQEFVTPTPQRTLAPPRYPERPRLANAPHYAVVVRIVIDPEGLVTSVSDSPIQESTPGPYAGDFREAVEAAVRRWRFWPGHIDQLEEGDDVDDDGKPDSVKIVKSDLVSVFYDVRFDFDIVAGEPRVTSTATPSP